MKEIISCSYGIKSIQIDFCISTYFSGKIVPLETDKAGDQASGLRISMHIVPSSPNV